MHSPEVLVFSIRSPFPSMRRKAKVGNPRWRSPIRRARGIKFRYSPFMTLAGYEFYFDSWVMVWHYEPGGRDALTVCRDRYKNRKGEWKFTSIWKWHFWHWKITPSLLYKWRRYLLTRCAECGGPSRKGHMVNVSDGGWDGHPKVPLWCGEVHLFHSECLSKKTKYHHSHDPRGCYSCSGSSSFDFNRKQANTRTVARQLFGPQKR